MTFIPDVRTDENYNQNMLNNNDKLIIDGYDMAVDALENALSNLTFLDTDTSISSHLLNYNIHSDADNKKVTLLEHITRLVLESLECSRDTIVVSMLDEYEEE